jgi:Protein of unknown function (DUF3761)
MRGRYSTILGLAVALVFGAASQNASAQAPASVCKDGSSSTVTGRGACSGHGGVDANATKKAQTAAAKAEKDAKVAKAKTKAVKEETKAEKATERAETTKVTCADGATSAGGRGACSGHGGIAKSNPVQRTAEKAETKAAKAEAKVQTAQAKVGSGAGEDNNAVGAIAKCKDGLYSHARNRRGACSRHGGVASWM